MSTDNNNYFKRPDGITEIFPVYPENIPKPNVGEKLLGHDQPFLENNEDSLFCIRDAVSLCHTQDPNVVKAILTFEIRPESWTLTYVHTQELNGFETVEDDDGTPLHQFDFYYTPIEEIYSNFSNHILKIMQACVDYMINNPDLSTDAVNSIEDTIRELNYSKATDFTIDVYIPPQLCDLTGERYFRPGGELYKCFDNPLYDTDFEPTKIFKSFLHGIVAHDIPQLGLTLSCDEYLRTEKYFREEEERRIALSQKIEKLSKKFKTYQYPPPGKTLERKEMRHNSMPTIAQQRKVMRPFIIPKHWRYE